MFTCGGMKRLMVATTALALVFCVPASAGQPSPKKLRQQVKELRHDVKKFKRQRDAARKSRDTWRASARTYLAERDRARTDLTAVQAQVAAAQAQVAQLTPLANLTPGLQSENAALRSYLGRTVLKQDATGAVDFWQTAGPRRTAPPAVTLTGAESATPFPINKGVPLIVRIDSHVVSGATWRSGRIRLGNIANGDYAEFKLGAPTTWDNQEVLWVPTETRTMAGIQYVLDDGTIPSAYELGVSFTVFRG